MIMDYMLNFNIEKMAPPPPPNVPVLRFLSIKKKTIMLVLFSTFAKPKPHNLTMLYILI